MGYHIVWAYGSLCMAIFLVRTLKRVIFQEARAYSEYHSVPKYLPKYMCCHYTALVIL